jgi:ferrous-iron efflux pump FieF
LAQVQPVAVPPPVARLDIAQQHALMRLATRASLAVALGLLVIKLFAWHWTGSVSLLASLLDSAVDATASGVTLVAVHASLQPADREHRFGHGKLEPLAALAQALLIVASAVALAFSAIERLRAPRPVEQGMVGVAVMVVASLATLALVRFQKRVVLQTGSSAVTADSMHYRSDLLMNAGVAVSLVASSQLGLPIVDPLLGLFVAGLIAHGAWSIAHDAVQLLMDREFPDEERRRIKQIVLAHPDAKGLHDLRTRRSGTLPFIQFHLELDGEMTLQRAHEIGEEVEASILAHFPDAEIIVHADPDSMPPDGPNFGR